MTSYVFAIVAALALFLSVPAPARAQAAVANAQIDGVSYAASFSCERDIFAMFCFVAKATFRKGCINVGETGMGWGTFAPGSPRDAKWFAFFAATPGVFDAF